AVLAAPDQALFLIPDRAEQKARLLGRGPLLGTSDGMQARANATERDLLISARFAREARELRLAALTVDRPLDELVELAAAHFAPAIDRGPRGGDLAGIRQFENEAVATQVRLYRESLASVTLPDDALPFACECGASGCAAEVELTLADYDAISAGG